MEGYTVDGRAISFLTRPLTRNLLLVSLLIASSVLLWNNLHSNLGFDDAFMFYRYALHLRAGLGVSWNLDKVHTLGETSPMWAFLVWAGSYLPLPPGKLLQLGSSLSSIAAVLAIAFAIRLNAQSFFLKSLSRTAFVLILCLGISGIFLANTGTGMETMLAFAANGLFCGYALRWLTNPSAANSWKVGLAALLAFLIRPESALAVVTTILLATLLLRNERFRAINALLPLAVIFIGILSYIGTCKLYFGTALPLPFYIKALHFYKGYMGRKHPVQRALQFFGSCSASFFLLIWLTKRPHVRMVLVFLLPLLLTAIYLCTVTQLMGQNARYYVPYYPYVILPAFVVLDAAIVDVAFVVDNPLMRVVATTLFFALCGGFFPSSLILRIDDKFEGPRIRYAEAKRMENATLPLPPVAWERGWRDLTDEIIVKLPTGATAAATEVGYMGAMASSVNVIDLSGLNDKDIALHGFNMDAFLARRPDIVWLPFTDYTYMRGTFFSSQQFLADYTVYDGFLNYGIALRRESPYYAQMMNDLRLLWAKEYGGYAMSDYEVRSAGWDDKPLSF